MFLCVKVDHERQALHVRRSWRQMQRPELWPGRCQSV